MRCDQRFWRPCWTFCKFRNWTKTGLYNFENIILEIFSETWRICFDLVWQNPWRWQFPWDFSTFLDWQISGEISLFSDFCCLEMTNFLKEKKQKTWLFPTFGCLKMTNFLTNLNFSTFLTVLKWQTSNKFDFFRLLTASRSENSTWYWLKLCVFCFENLSKSKLLGDFFLLCH